MKLENKLQAYYITAILSLVFAVVGFSYNAWRLEATEDNNNIRTASFEVLGELAELEQIIYAAHYDKDEIEGNPRKAWVKVGLVVDLSALISKSVEKKSLNLRETWSKNWPKIINATLDLPLTCMLLLPFQYFCNMIDCIDIFGKYKRKQESSKVPG